MPSTVGDRVSLWAETVGIDADLLPPRVEIEGRFGPISGDEPGPCRPGADPLLVAAWERRHGFSLPSSLRAWLKISDGFYHNGPMVHPLTAIGPMIPFARVPGLIVQPESWFELGNPESETICIDLAYRWPGGGFPIFASGDDQRRSRPTLIAGSFEAWFLRLIHEGGREYWFDPGFVPLGDPWLEHRRRTPVPPLPDRLLLISGRVGALLRVGADDRAIASNLGISRFDVEAILRHLQHVPAEEAGKGQRSAGNG